MGIYVSLATASYNASFPPSAEILVLVRWGDTCSNKMSQLSKNPPEGSMCEGLPADMVFPLACQPDGLSTSDIAPGRRSTKLPAHSDPATGSRTQQLPPPQRAGPLLPPSLRLSTPSFRSSRHPSQGEGNPKPGDRANGAARHIMPLPL